MEIKFGNDNEIHICEIAIATKLKRKGDKQRKDNHRNKYS